MKPSDFEHLLSIGAVVALLTIISSVAGLMDRVELEHLPQHAHYLDAAPGPIDPHSQPEAHIRQVKQQEVDARFQQAVMMLHAKRYEYAIAPLQRVLELAPQMAEAHVNMGYALLGLEDYTTAHDAFMVASEIQPFLANSYYGMALALEGMKEYEAAVGAIRSYLHLTKDQAHIEKAQAMLDRYTEQAQLKNELAANQ